MEKNPLYICRANLDKNIHFLDYLLSDGQSLEYNTNKALRTMHAQYLKLITMIQLSMKLIGIQGNI